MREGLWAQKHVDLVISLALFLFALGCYANTLSAHLQVSWDDQYYITTNPLIRELSPVGLWRMWSQFYFWHYIPVTLTSYALDYQLWGLHPLGYHLTNVLLHALNGVLVYLLCQRLYPSRLASGLAAVLFIAHPLQVETVAWVSERKNVLSLFFFLLAMVAHMRDHQAAARWYTRWLVWGSYGLAVFAKPIVVCAPLLFMVYDVYWAGYSRRRAILRNLPLVGLALLEVVLTMLAVKDQPATQHYWENNPWLTALLMLRICWDYVVSLVAPLNLNVRYAYELADVVGNIRIWFGLGVLTLLGVVAWRQPLGKPLSRFAILWVVVFFLPVSNIIPFSIQRADRYLYFPSIALFLLLGLVVHRLWQRFASPSARWLLMGGMAALILPLLVLTIERNKVWANSGSVWQDHLAGYPNSLNGLINLGVYYFDQQAYTQAERTLRRMLQYEPKQSKTYYYLARCAFETKRYTEAVMWYREALALRPQQKVYHNNLGYTYVKLKRYEEAIQAYQAALALEPRYVRAWANLGEAALHLRRYSQAQTAFETVLQQRPKHFSAVFGLCQTFIALGELTTAAEQCRQAVHLHPKHARSLHHLAWVLLRQDQPMAALPWAQKAVAVAPRRAQGYRTLGKVYAALGKTTQAQEAYHTAEEIAASGHQVQQEFETSTP